MDLMSLTSLILRILLLSSGDCLCSNFGLGISALGYVLMFEEFSRGKSSNFEDGLEGFRKLREHLRYVLGYWETVWT